MKPGGSGEGVAPCKVNYDPTTAKEMLLMATTLEEQQAWVARLAKRIQKSGYKAAAVGAGGSIADISMTSVTGGGGSRVSPQESMRSSYKGPSSGSAAAAAQQKASTLPGNASLSSSTKKTG